MLCLLIGGSGIGYVWQKSQIDELGKQILKREKRLKELDEQNTKLCEHLAKMRNPLYLKVHIKELKLGLVEVPLSQVCRLPEPPRQAPAPLAETQYAAQAAAPAILP